MLLPSSQGTGWSINFLTSQFYVYQTSYHRTVAVFLYWMKPRCTLVIPAGRDLRNHEHIVTIISNVPYLLS